MADGMTDIERAQKWLDATGISLAWEADLSEIAGRLAALLSEARQRALREAAAEIRARSTSGEYYYGPGGGWDEDTLDYYGVSNWLEARADDMTRTSYQQVDDVVPATPSEGDER